MISIVFCAVVSIIHFTIVLGTTKYCDSPYICANTTTSGSEINIYGYKSAQHATLLTSNGTITISGAYSAQFSQSILSNNTILCRSTRSCSNVANIASTISIECSAALACADSLLTVNKHDTQIDCIGDKSCSNAIISGAAVVHGSGSGSLRNATIMLHNNNGLTSSDANVTLGGFYSGYNTTIICHDGMNCIINCRGNGCLNTVVLGCVNENTTCIINCHSNKNMQNHICPFIGDDDDNITYTEYHAKYKIYFMFYEYFDNKMLDIVKQSIINDENCQLTFDDYLGLDQTQEPNYNGTICCRGYISCIFSNNITVNINSNTNSSHNYDIVCSGGHSCHYSSYLQILNAYSLNPNFTQSKGIFCAGWAACTSNKGIKPGIDGTVYCGGRGSCSSSNVFGGKEVYCAGIYSCLSTKFYSVSNIYLLSTNDNSFPWTNYLSEIYSNDTNATVTLETGTMNVYLMGYRSGGSINIQCNGNGDICNIFCLTNSACVNEEDYNSIYNVIHWYTNITCHDGAFCNVYCDPNNGIHCGYITSLAVVGTNILIHNITQYFGKTNTTDLVSTTTILTTQISTTQLSHTIQNNSTHITTDQFTSTKTATTTTTTPTATTSTITLTPAPTMMTRRTTNTSVSSTQSIQTTQMQTYMNQTNHGEIQTTTSNRSQTLLSNMSTISGTDLVSIPMDDKPDSLLSELTTLIIIVLGGCLCLALITIMILIFLLARRKNDKNNNSTNISTDTDSKLTIPKMSNQLKSKSASDTDCDVNIKIDHESNAVHIAKMNQRCGVGRNDRDLQHGKTINHDQLPQLQNYHCNFKSSETSRTHSCTDDGDEIDREVAIAVAVGTSGLTMSEDGIQSIADGDSDAEEPGSTQLNTNSTHTQSMHDKSASVNVAINDRCGAEMENFMSDESTELQLEGAKDRYGYGYGVPFVFGDFRQIEVEGSDDVYDSDKIMANKISGKDKNEHVNKHPEQKDSQNSDSDISALFGRQVSPAAGLGKMNANNFGKYNYPPRRTIEGQKQSVQSAAVVQMVKQKEEQEQKQHVFMTPHLHHNNVNVNINSAVVLVQRKDVKPRAQKMKPNVHGDDKNTKKKKKKKKNGKEIDDEMYAKPNKVTIRATKGHNRRIRLSNAKESESTNE